MALSNIILLCQVAGYVIACILSLCIVVPMSLHQDEFKLVINCFYQLLLVIILYLFQGSLFTILYWYLGRDQWTI